MSGTLYERLGQREGIRAVVDDFYDRLLADDDLAPFFEGADVERLRETQTDFLCEAAGGPETYDAPGVREAHQGLDFEPAHIEAADRPPAREPRRLRRARGRRGGRRRRRRGPRGRPARPVAIRRASSHPAPTPSG